MRPFLELVFDSYAFKIYERATGLWSFLIESIVRLWYFSHTYNFFSTPARYLSKKIPASTIKFQPAFLGIALAVILIVPHKIWYNFYAVPVFLAVSIMFLSCSAATRSGGNFVTAMSVVLLIIFICALTVPYLALRPLLYLALAISFFFLVSFGLDSEEDIYSFLYPIYLLTAALCAIAFMQSLTPSITRGVRATLSSSIAFAELIIIFTPFCLVFANMQKSKIRSNFYAAAVLILSFAAIVQTHPNTGLWAYAIAISTFVLIANRKWTPLILLFFPALWLGIFRQLFGFWQNHLHDRNLLEALYYTGTNIWQNSVGVASSEFLNAYSSMSARTAQGAIEIPYVRIPASYLKILTEAGAVILFAFLWYTIRLAHSCLIAIFGPNDDRKMLFVAGFSVLLAISVSGIFENTLFEPRILIPYWSMMGLIAVNKRIKLNLQLTN